MSFSRIFCTDFFFLSFFCLFSSVYCFLRMLLLYEKKEKIWKEKRKSFDALGNLLHGRMLLVTLLRFLGPKAFLQCTYSLCLLLLLVVHGWLGRELYDVNKTMQLCKQKQLHFKLLTISYAAASYRLLLSSFLLKIKRDYCQL